MTMDYKPCQQQQNDQFGQLHFTNHKNIKLTKFTVNFKILKNMF